MASLIVRFVDAPGLITSAIDFAENGIWPHVEIGTPEQTWIGAHAPGGVQERPYDYCTAKRERRYGIPCSDQQLASLLTSARKAIGTPYDYLDIAGLLFHLPRLFDNHRLICSWFVFREAWQVGIRLANLQPEYGHLITPDSLHLSAAFLDRCVFQFPKEA